MLQRWLGLEGHADFPFSFEKEKLGEKQALCSFQICIYMGSAKDARISGASGSPQILAQRMDPDPGGAGDPNPEKRRLQFRRSPKIQVHIGSQFSAQVPTHSLLDRKSVV